MKVQFHAQQKSTLVSIACVIVETVERLNYKKNPICNTFYMIASWKKIAEVIVFPFHERCEKLKFHFDYFYISVATTKISKSS